jgi:hypothetical protein
MPYVSCARCGLIAFSAAFWSSVDRCARCDAVLPRTARLTRPAPGWTSSTAADAGTEGRS